MMDLADYLQAEVGRTSIRKVAKATGVSKTTIDNIVNRRLKTMPDVATLEKIARAYGMTLPVVVEMAGAALGDGERARRLARELEAHPWIAERFDELTSMTREEFTETMDYLAFRRERLAPRPNGDQSTL